MDDRIRVFVYAEDAVTQAGLEYLLRLCSGLYVVPSGEIDGAEVAVIGAERMDEATTRTVGGIQRDGCPKVAVVTTSLDDAAIVAAGQAGVLGLMRRSHSSAEGLAAMVRQVASGRASIPDDLLVDLLVLAGRAGCESRPPGSCGVTAPLTDREQEVLRLLADGCDTTEIASSLCYSERTVKGVIHEVTTRLNLRNRSHAVAYALRNGMI